MPVVSKPNTARRDAGPEGTKQFRQERRPCLETGAAVSRRSLHVHKSRDKGVAPPPPGCYADEDLTCDCSGCADRHRFACGGRPAPCCRRVSFRAGSEAAQEKKRGSPLALVGSRAPTYRDRARCVCWAPFRQGRERARKSCAASPSGSLTLLVCAVSRYLGVRPCLPRGGAGSLTVPRGVVTLVDVCCSRNAVLLSCDFSGFCCRPVRASGLSFVPVFLVWVFPLWVPPPGLVLRLALQGRFFGFLRQHGILIVLAAFSVLRGVRQVERFAAAVAFCISGVFFCPSQLQIKEAAKVMGLHTLR